MTKNPTATRIVWTVTLCTALSLFGDATMYTVLPSHYPRLGLTAYQVGWLLSVNRLARLPLNLVSGYVSDRFGRRAPFAIGIALGVVSTAGYGLCSDFSTLVALRALWGVAWSLLIVAAYGLILDASDDETRGRHMGLFSGVSFFGGAIGAMLGGMLADSLGFSRTMLILGACTALGVFGALTLPRSPRASGTRHTAHHGTGGGFKGALRAFVDVARQRPVVLILVLIGIQRFVLSGVYSSTFGRYLAEMRPDGLRIGSLAIGIAGLTGSLVLVRNSITIVVAPLAGRLSDMMRDRRRVLMAGLALGALGLAGLALIPSSGAVALGILTIAVAHALVPPMLVAWIGDTVSADRQGSALGAYQTLGDLGSGLGPLVAYPLIEGLGMRLTYGASACLLAAAVPFILVELRRRSSTTGQ